MTIGSGDDDVAVLNAKESFQATAHTTESALAALTVLAHAPFAAAIRSLALPLAVAIHAAVHSRSVVLVVHQGTDADSRRQCHATEQQAADENATDDYRHACGVVVPEAARARWGRTGRWGDRLHRQLWVRFSVWVRFLTGCGWHGWAGGRGHGGLLLSGAMTCLRVARNNDHGARV